MNTNVFILKIALTDGSIRKVIQGNMIHIDVTTTVLIFLVEEVFKYLQR